MSVAALARRIDHSGKPSSRLSSPGRCGTGGRRSSSCQLALSFAFELARRAVFDAAVADPVGHPGFAAVVADLQPAVEGADDLEGRASPHTKAKAVNAAKRINLNSSLLDWVCIHFGCKIKLNTEDVERAEVNSSKSRNEIAG